MKSTKAINEDAVIMDATGQRLGILAVRIAHLLQGKDRSDYLPHQDNGHRIVVENIDKLSLDPKKLQKKIYWHYTGYPGGIHQQRLEKAWQQDSKKVLLRAVSGMLPKNKLRSDRLRRFEIK